MKATDKDKTIHTMPKGVWEGGIVNERKKPSKEQQLDSITTDLQGNGYPIPEKRQQD